MVRSDIWYVQALVSPKNNEMRFLASFFGLSRKCWKSVLELIGSLKIELVMLITVIVDTSQRCLPYASIGFPKKIDKNIFGLLFRPL